ncbi:MAG TPA: hypothetical protein VFV70_14685 [Hyphomonadaceae bacterium]|nr:hypothetical protein [Hyphomonadaceae bacterium]
MKKVMYNLPYNGRMPLLGFRAMRKIARFAAIFAAACALSQAAFADPYKVKDLMIDKTAATAAEARQQGANEARLAGAQRLIERLTLPEDLAQAREPVDATVVATRLARNQETQEQIKTFQAPGGFRVTGVVAQNFVANDVRNYFDQLGVPYVDAQAAKALLVPSVAGGVDAGQWSAQWTQTVAQGGQNRIVGLSDDTVLTPYVASIEAWQRRPSFVDVQSEISSSGADHAIIAEAYSQGGIYVRLIDLRTNGGDSGLGTVGPFSDLASARRGAIAELERAWKVRSIVRTAGSTDIALTASFSNIGEWVKIRKSLETSRLVNRLNIESLTTSGADLRFAYSGRPDQLAADLRAKGVELRSADNGWVLRAVSAQ